MDVRDRQRRLLVLGHYAGAKRSLLDNAAVPVTIASWAVALFLIYKLIMQEKAPAAVSLMSLCLVLEVAALTRAKALSNLELKFVGFSCLLVGTIAAGAVLNGVR
ncbi:hypothetical protein [Caulobacter sp.]|uniref:hypothetical protein n=1 Tax=Caulobacter sp. TaxID=78 RepID=UPI0031D410F1